MSVDLWIRARSGPQLGIGHRVRALILAQAFARLGRAAGLILDEDAPSGPDRIPVHRLPAGALPPEEVQAYPKDGVPVVLDLSHPSMLDALPEQVRRLNALGGRVGLIDGLGPEAYVPLRPDSHVEIALTPYVLEPDAPQRSAKLWLSGPQYAVLGPAYETAPDRPATDRDRTLLVSISGTDPWALTEAVSEALCAGGLPQGWRARLVLGPGFEATRLTAFQALAGKDDRIDLIMRPDGLRPHLVQARLAVLGPGLAKYEAAACGTFSLIVSPDPTYAAMNRPFAEQGLAQLLAPGAPSADRLHQAIVDADRQDRPDPRTQVDGAGAHRAATRFISKLFTESGEA